MSDALRVVIEIGPKGRRCVAGALDWPGLDRWGTDEDDAVAKLSSYVPRYAAVAERSGMADELARQATPTVVERYAGNTSTDWWGIAHVTSETEREVLSTKDLERRLDLVQACWDQFDTTSDRVSEELQKGPRGGGRSRDEIVRHVYASERHNFWRKVGLRMDDGVRLSPSELAALRAKYVDLIREFNADGKPARSWSIQFLLRRTAQHATDHAWEMEDRDLSAQRSPVESADGRSSLG
jgi:hypothetical protein